MLCEDYICEYGVDVDENVDFDPAELEEFSFTCPVCGAEMECVDKDYSYSGMRIARYVCPDCEEEMDRDRGDTWVYEGGPYDGCIVDEDDYA